MGRAVRLALALLFASTFAATAATSRPTLFDLPLGQLATALATDFKSYACGSNGGPPAMHLAGWRDFRRCPPDAEGLHEVAVEYDDADERVARAAGNPAAAWGLGTSIDYFPIIASALFDDAGRLQGLRLVTDARPDQQKTPFVLYRPYGEHYLLQLYLMDRFGMTAADCRDLPLARGQSPVFGIVANRVCDRTDASAGRRYHIEARFYRRRGEHDVDADTGRATKGQFLSETRAEIRAIGEWNRGTPPRRAPRRR
jgi:hypothetical protein